MEQVIFFSYQQYRCIVQDRLEVQQYVEDAFKKRLPSSIASRISFEAIDFFQNQPQREYDVYILRYIIHHLV